jgi:hypothetical protein
MTELVFVMGSRQNHFFVELADALRHELAALGVAARITTDGFPPQVAGEICALLPPHEFFALEGFRTRPDPRLLSRTVLICAEQPGSRFFRTNVALADLAGAVFDIHTWAVEELNRRGVAARHLQLGWSSSWKARDTPRRRDVDALFLGAVSARRLRHLGGYADSLADLRWEVLLSDNARPNDQNSPGYLTGEQKWELLGRTRVLLNLHVGDRPYFEWLRVIQAIVNGCAVVSEHSVGFAPLVPGEHFISGRPETLATLALELTEDEALRATVTSSAQELVREQLPLQHAAMQLAETIERLDRSVPIRSARHRADSAALPPTFPAQRMVVGDTRPERAIKDAYITAVGLRRRAHQIAARDRSVRVERCSTGYEAMEPRVSIIVALFDHAGEISTALESVRRSSYGAVEIIVVDDGSRDSSAQVVRDWIAANESVAAALLRHPFNRGLPHARNLALEFARGEYAFVLDADNALYRHGLTRLMSALDRSPQATFAYGLLQRFDDTGPIGMANVWPWDPERLRAYNYIDAMALMRRDRIIEVGGYTTDPRLFGWEDYDLWCKLVEAGHTGVQVTQFVGRYRVSERSMLRRTNISTTRAFRTLERRHPRVMAPAADGSGR